MKDKAINTEGASVSAPPEKRSDLKAYIAIARPDHWTKNIFILPGLFLAQLIGPRPVRELLLPLFLGTVATCLSRPRIIRLTNGWTVISTDFIRKSDLARRSPGMFPRRGYICNTLS